MEIVVIPGNWGASQPEDVAAVVRSVTQQLDPYFESRPTGLIQVVSRPNSRPEVMYRANPDDPYRMFVSATDRRWARLAYQSAHEYCHILSDFERLRARSNQWFHESICEMASLFCLLRMAASWQVDAPYSNWTDYAVHLKTYAAREMDRACGGPPQDKSLKGWLRQNRDILRGDPYLRDLNRIVANRLLPLFQSVPKTWECVAHMPDSDEDFEEFLVRWQASVPANRRADLAPIARLFA